MAFDRLLYAGTTSGIYRYDRYREVWQITQSQSEAKPITSLVIDPQHGILYAGQDDTLVLQSADNGQTWQPLGAQLSASATVLAVDPEGSYLYAGLDNAGGLFRYGRDTNKWENLNLDIQGAVTALAIGAYGVIYVGTTDGLWLYVSPKQIWQQIEIDNRQDPVAAIVLDRRNGVLYVGQRNGRVFRADVKANALADLAFKLVIDGLPALVGSSTMALDEQNRLLYIGVANGLVYRYWDVNQDTQPTTNILPHNSPIQSLLWDADQGLIYAGLQQGRVFRSADYGQNWLSISDELPDAADILALAIGVPQSYTTYKALDELRARDEAINRQQGSLPYPVILSLSSQTRLPAFLRTRLLTPLSVQIDDQSESPSITEVLTPLQIQAIFGLSSTQPDDLDENLSEQLNSQLKPGRILKLTGKTSQNGNQQAHQLRHLTWHQYYHELPVIGGSVRVHGVIEEDRIAVTNSYFPIPLDYAFTSTPERTEAPLAPHLSLEAASTIACEAVAKKPSQKAAPQLLETTEPSRPATNESRWDRWKKQLYSLINQFRPGNNPEAYSQTPSKPPEVQPVPRQIVSVKHLNIKGSDYAILPFAGAYYLISRFLVHDTLTGDWFVEVDMKSGQVVGEPWQSALRAPYYKDANDVLTDAPSGDSLLLFTELATYKAELDLPGSFIDLNSADFTSTDFQAQRTTVAAQAMILYHHLRTHCGMESEQLRPDDLTINLEFVNDGTTLFNHIDSTHATLSFRLGNNVEIEEGPQIIVNPTREREVLLHEITHLLLWIFDRDTWDTPPTLKPFGRAMQEGYAMYLSRSVTANNDAAEINQPWARTAYPPASWGDRWRFARSTKAPGADFLLSARNYPESLQVGASIDVYDVSMVWARALWDIRQVMGEAWQQVDQLAIQAYPYLHGHLINFEPTVHGFLDAQIKLDNIDLTTASQTIWLGRGVIAGRAIHDIAGSDGVFIAAGDEGLFRYDNAHNIWQLDNQLADGTRLTGVIAVAIEGNDLYAAAQLPTSATAGQQTQWLPGVFHKQANEINWQPLDTWPQDAIPTCLLALDNGVVMAGTDKGIYIWYEQQIDATGTFFWQWTHHPSTVDLNILGLTRMEEMMVNGESVRRVRACGSNDLRQHFWSISRAQIPWSAPTPHALDLLEDATEDRTPRLTAITTWQVDNNLVGSLNGLWHVTANWQNTVQVEPVTEPILALATAPNGQDFYFATPTGVYHGNNLGTAPTSLPGPGVSSGLPQGTLVSSLHASATNNIFAGTLTNGIWRYDGTNWQQTLSQVTVLSVPDPVTIANEGVTWRSFVLETAQLYTLIINNPSGILDGLGVSIAQVGFPLTVLPGQANALGIEYQLGPAPIIMALSNHTGHPITIELSQDTINHTFTITT